MRWKLRSGPPFPEVVAREILGPLSLEETGFDDVLAARRSRSARGEGGGV